MENRISRSGRFADGHLAAIYGCTYNCRSTITTDSILLQSTMRIPCGFPSRNFEETNHILKEIHLSFLFVFFFCLSLVDNNPTNFLKFRPLLSTRKKCQKNPLGWLMKMFRMPCTVQFSNIYKKFFDIVFSN